MRLALPLTLILLFVACSEPNGQKAPTPVNGPETKGTNSSGGGDTYASEFSQIAEDILARLLWKDKAVAAAVSTERFRKAVQETAIKTVEAALYHPTNAANFVHPLCVEGLNPVPSPTWNRVDAINCPDQKQILLSLVNWKTMSLFEKRRLVVHEYLGIIGVPDSRYEKSHEILKLLSLRTTVRINPLTIFGPLAKSIIEAIQWRFDQIEVVDQKLSDDAVLQGRVLRLKNSSGEILECEEGSVQLNDTFNTMRFSVGESCSFKNVDAQLWNGGELVIQDDKEGILWKALAPNESDKTFDRGFVQGNFEATLIFQIRD